MLATHDQGPQLTGRLRDHRRMIMTVEKWAMEHPDPANHPLRVADFDYRRLVVASNAQMMAEQCLIGLFQPIWNNEMNICWGISKHGDSAGTRANKRSPWDVLHPGRPWAMDPRLENSRTPDDILSAITAHVECRPAYGGTHQIIDTFLAEFAQAPVERRRADDPETLEAEATA
ncbi:MAG: Eco29kI family restriction endonuclease [Alphaproteobacteria bacterium]|nr:Eco29kI family restriction endonuclease [Alphaproteobacteria bacterium]